MKLFKKLKKSNNDEELNISQEDVSAENNKFTSNTTTLKDLISADYVDFSESPKYGLIGEKYMKNLYIGILPSSVTFPNYLDELYRFGNIDVSLYIRPIENEDALADLSKLRNSLEVEFTTAGGSNNRRDDMAAKVYEAKRLREEVRDGYNKIYQVATLATLVSNTPRQLENDCNRLRQTMGRRDIGIKNAIYIQEDCYLSNKPLMFNTMNEYHTFDKRSLACTFPFTTSNINHRNGIPIGRNIDNGLPVIFDTFDRSLKNYNMCIFATTGGGKSTFLKMLAARGATFDEQINICIDIEPEYNDIAKILGGQIITITHNTDTILNFFDVTTEKVKNKLNGKDMEVVNLTSKINSVTDIILTMAKGFTGSNDEYYNDITRRIIKDCITEIYKDNGINDKPSSLYENTASKLNDNGELIGGYRKKDMPTLSDWYKKLEDLAKANKKDTYTKYYDYLLSVMKEYTNYTKGGFTAFDGQSTVNLTTDVPFINFDVSSLNEETELPLAQHIICDYIWETLVKKNDKGKKLRVIVDEAWRMAKIINGKPKFPEALNFLEKLFRRARKKNTSAVIISQQFNEFYNDLTQSIIRNSDTKVFLPPDDTSIDEIAEVFHLTQGEMNYLKNTKRGEALFKCGSASAKLKVEIPPFELEFVETNQNEMFNVKNKLDDLEGDLVETH